MTKLLKAIGITTIITALLIGSGLALVYLSHFIGAGVIFVPLPLLLFYMVWETLE